MKSAMRGDQIRRTEVIAALSVATDMAIGQPLEFALKSCVLSVWFAQALGRGADEIREVYYQALLRYIGCNADTYALAALFGDEMQFRREIARIDLGNDREVLATVFRSIRRANAGRPLYGMLAAVVKGLAVSRSTSVSILAGHCEVAERIAARLGFDTAVVRNLGQLYERWDGKGLPHGLKGEAISPAVRLVTLMQDTIVLAESHGGDAALSLLKKRRGGAYDPDLVDRFLPCAADLLSRITGVVAWEQVLELEPRPQMMLPPDAFDEACLAIADFVDMRAPYSAGHSRAVAALSEAAARHCGLPEADIVLARRAGLVHDIGEMAVPMATWIKSDLLSDRERDEIRLHPYYSERILAPCAALRQVGAVAGQHHERLNGSGYHRALGAGALSPISRILAAAETYQTKLEPRPHRPALSPEAAADELKRQVRAGGLDSEAAAGVLAAAGHRVAAVRRQLTADLTTREIEVLRLIAGGKSTKEIARTLGVATKTADNHTQSIYAKIGVSTRAAAALFAIEHGLVAAGWQK
jgi:HD-GYP domain-containing protein (c-di-GMP phosphodiesterase class II)